MIVSKSTISQDVEQALHYYLYPSRPYRPVPKHYDDPANLNPALCAECGGYCCQTCGCSFSPDDFPEISFDCLESELQKGLITIEFIDGEQVLRSPNSYIVRMRNVGAPVIEPGYFHSQRTGPCVAWTEFGCRFDYEHRPTGGRLLIPKASYDEQHGLACYARYAIVDCYDEWIPFKKILARLVTKYKGREIPPPTFDT